MSVPSPRVGDVTSTTITPYGSAALDALRQAVHEAKAGDPLAVVTVVVPDNITGLVVRRALSRGLGAAEGSGVAGLVVTTLPRLAESVVSGSLSPRVPATGAVVAAQWRRALRDEPGHFAQVAQHPATIRALVGAHHELRDLDAVSLAAVAGSGQLAADVVRLHERVQSRLAERWYDATDLLHEATERVLGGMARALAPTIVFAPARTTAAQQRFLAAIASHASLRVVAALTGVQRADGSVVAGLRAAGLDVSEARGMLDPPVATGIRHASDADDEVRLVVREVATLLETTPAERIAVLYAASSPYARLLHERCAQAGIQVNGRGVRSVHERAIARGFLGLLRLHESDFARAEVMRVLSEAPVRLMGERVHVSRWDQISRAAAVVEGDDWDVRLGEWARARLALATDERAAAQPRERVIERAERDAESATALRNGVGWLRHELDSGAQLRTWPQLAAWAAELFAAVYGETAQMRWLPAEEQYAAAAITSAIQALSVLADVEGPADLATAIEVIELDLEAAVPRVGRFGEGVHVSPLGESAMLEVDVVIAVGLAEDSYPGRLHEDAVLNEAARAAAPGLVPLRTRIDDRHRALLAALACAETAIVTFPRGDLRRSTHRLPSRFVLPSLRHLARDESGPVKDLAASDWDQVPDSVNIGSPSFASSLLRASSPADEQEWRVRAAAAGELPADHVVDAARAMTAARDGDAFTRFDGNLAGVAGLPDHASGLPVVAPTSLEQYAKCPHAWFVERLLRVSPLDVPEEVIEVSPLEVGNLLHTCLDRLVSEASVLPSAGAAWSAKDRARLLQIFEEEADAAAARGVTGHRRLWELERRALTRDLIRMLDDDDAWRSSRGASVLASELSFGSAGAPPVHVPLARGAVAMRGSADKVDRAADGTLLVTDVKTGSSWRYDDIAKDPVVAGTRLQLPVYAHAARTAYGTPRAEAMYWFVRKDAGKRIAVTLDEDLEVRFAEAVGTLVDSIAAGQFPAIAPEDPDFAWVTCPYCNPDGLGHAERRERWERQRHDPALSMLVGLVDPQTESAAPEGTER